ncbi:MAG: hypothetical protein LBR81_09420 [Prevotellaceae bacterium]|jgi:lipopolysaccharide export system protein LptA|nr:hypothetical protein [Prevotellaceae bacterium]
MKSRIFKFLNFQIFLIGILAYWHIDNLHAAEKVPIYLEHSETLSFDNEALPDCEVLEGNVIFRHENTRLYCDRANFYEKQNMVDALGNVHIVQGDSLHIYGEFLHYDGNTKMGRIKGKVSVEQNNSILETDSLDFNLNSNMGFYQTGGKIFDNENLLSSTRGELYFKQDLCVFSGDVQLIGKEMLLKTDMLHYNTKLKIAYFVAPTAIIYAEKTIIYTENGWYNTITEDALLTQRASIEHNDGKHLKADSIFYYKKDSTAIALRNIRLVDTVQQMTVCGHYGKFEQNGNRGLVRDSAFVIEHSTPDSLFLHADTLKTQGDSTYQLVRGIGNVRFFRIDLQGRCDSITYHSSDSILKMYENPVIWSDSTQLCGEFIQLFQKNQKIDMILVTGWALGVSQSDSTRFNQVQGKLMRAYMKNNQLDRVEVEGNAITIYYPKDDDGEVIGINRAESSNLTAYVKDKKMDKIVMKPASSGTLYPEEQIPEDQQQVTRFVWHEEIRPKNKADIFTRYDSYNPSNKKKIVGK